MIDNAWYGYFHLGALPRLDQKQELPRMEVLVAAPTVEEGEMRSEIAVNSTRFLQALKRTGFNVSADHAMFGASGWIDVLPRPLIEVHYTVKIWAAELHSRVQEYIGYHLSTYLKGNAYRGFASGRGNLLNFKLGLHRWSTSEDVKLVTRQERSSSGDAFRVRADCYRSQQTSSCSALRRPYRPYKVRLTLDFCPHNGHITGWQISTKSLICGRSSMAERQLPNLIS